MNRVCDNCGAELIPVLPDRSRRYDDDQWEGCLHLHLVGGYGEYVDSIYDSYHWRFCTMCADELMQYPIIKNLYGEDNEN